MYKKILVPLDGSGLAGKVLPHAKDMAAACGPSEIDLLFVVEPLRIVRSVFSDKDNDYFAQSDKKAEAWAKDYLGKIEQELKKDGLKVKSTVLIGKAAEEIINYSAKNSVDLIVISSHGLSGMSRLPFGSVAQKILSTSVSPVLIIRPSGSK